MRAMRVLDEVGLEECAVAMTRAEVRLFDTARAFDAIAGEYHASNTANPILEHMRARVFRTLCAHVPVGAELLDIGCGPGTDHPALVGAGYVVTGIDASPEMVRQAQRRADTLGGPHRPTVLCRPVDQVAKFQPGQFDAALSNFGPLNCASDLAAVARHLHDVLRTRGVFVASVIGRLCPWEMAIYLARGDPERAFLRLRSGMVPVPLKSGVVWTQYVSPRAFTQTFAAAGFRTVRLEGLGVVAPPPYLEAFALRRPALVRGLLEWDDAVGAWPLVRHLGDHFLVVLQRD